MEVRTKNFTVSDYRYSQLNNILNKCRQEYKKGKMDLRFLEEYENYLYPNESERRNVYDEIERISVATESLYGNTDVGFLNSYLSANIQTRLSLTFGKILRKQHAKNKSIYRKDTLFNLLQETMDIFGNKIEKLLQSDFIVTRVEEITTFPMADDKSALWHFDPVPVGYGKLFIMLSGSNETDGRTEYVGPEASFELIKSGASSLPLESRKNILSNDMEKEIKYISDHGDWLLFLPSVMCHRGSYPTRGRRRLLSINFLRSKLSWRECFDEIWEINQFEGNWVPSNWPIFNI